MGYYIFPVTIFDLLDFILVWSLCRIAANVVLIETKFEVQERDVDCNVKEWTLVTVALLQIEVVHTLDQARLGFSNEASGGIYQSCTLSVTKVLVLVDQFVHLLHLVAL